MRTNKTVFTFRKVTRFSSHAHKDCYRFTGFGDRPCQYARVPFLYATAPYAYFPYTYEVFVSSLFHWSWSKVDYQNPFVYTDERVGVSFEDYAEVEVMRYAESATSVGPDGGAYGTWFWAMPGSGVLLNLGKTVVFSEKAQALEWAERLPLNAIACEGTGECKHHSDTKLCSAARLEGYDSVVMNRVYRFVAHCSSIPSSVVEIVICPNAASLPLSHSACPALSLHKEDGNECRCDPASSVLSCDTRFQGLKEDGFVGYDARPYLMLANALALHAVAVYLAVRIARVLSQRFAPQHARLCCSRNRTPCAFGGAYRLLFPP